MLTLQRTTLRRYSLCRTTALRQAWRRGQPVDVHACIYRIEDGLLRDLGARVGLVEALEVLEAAMAARQDRAIGA
jgi:carbonic anhydrase